MPTKKEPFDIKDTESYQAVARSSGKKRLALLTQEIYDDAMERAIAAVRRRATQHGRHGPVPISISGLEVEIALRQELTELAGGHITIVGPTTSEKQAPTA